MIMKAILKARLIKMDHPSRRSIKEKRGRKRERGGRRLKLHRLKRKKPRLNQKKNQS
jgi:hypothetical protein